MDYGKFIMIVLLVQMLLYAVEIVFSISVLKASEGWYTAIKGGMLLVLLVVFALLGSSMKGNVENICYNQSMTFESYRIESDYIYLQKNNNTTIYPLVEGVDISQGECANE